MMKPMIAALMMALALSACQKSDNNPSSSTGGSTSSSAAPAGSGGAPSGLSGLGGNTKK